jgi:polysaccharide deacetylase 2 family uncharacterized protein YibQ
MATPKIITISDLKQGKLTITRNGTAVQIERRYVFLDEADTVIQNLGGGRVVETMAIADLPANITAALIAIDNWTYQQALLKEGMV